MSVLPMRAKTLNGNFYKFSVLDAPVYTGEGQVLLLGKKFSPVLVQDTILPGCDVDVFVGDVLEDENGKEWFTTYSKGFVTKHGTEYKYLWDFKDIKVTRQATQEEWQQEKISTPKIVYRSGDSTFLPTHIVGKYGRNLVVTSVKGICDITSVEQDLRCTIRGRKLYLGDNIVMCYGRICIQNEFGAYDIFTKQYIRRTI